MNLFGHFLNLRFLVKRAVIAGSLIICSGLNLYSQTPGAPTNLMATPGDGYLAISFTPGSDGGSPITNYEYTLDGSGWTAFNPTVTSTTVVISGLSNCTLYTVQLRAVNSAGSGTASASVTASPSNLVAGITWTSRTSAVEIPWWGVTYGNGLFVAVATSGIGNRVMTSPNGVTWTSRTSAADNEWRSIAYGNGLFVAVAQSGTGNRVMTSPDGISWTSRTSAANNNWTSVTYGNGLFVAVSGNGTGNRVMTSSDGVTWTIRSSAAGNFWSSVTYGNGLFVAVATSGTGNRVMTSPDGISWTSRTSAADNNWTSVTYGNGLFVAVSSNGTGNRVMTSSDGVTWTIRSSAAGNTWSSVTYGNGLFVAVANSGTGNRVMTSPDGITWSSRTSATDNPWRSVIWGGTAGQEKFVAVSSFGSGDRVMTSAAINPSMTCNNSVTYDIASSSLTSSTILSSITNTCGDLVYTLSKDSWTCADVGTVTYTTLTVTDTGGNVTSCTVQVTVTYINNVTVTYTGVTLATTTNKSANVTLSATITLPAGANASQQAQLRFINRDTGQDLSGWLALTGTSNIGTASYTAALTLGTYEIFRKYNIGFEVGNIGCYTRNSSADNVTVTVAEPSCGCY
jgi:hypothetical protein